MGIDIYNIAHNAISQAMILVFVFVTTPATKRVKSKQLPWYDIVLIVLSAVVMFYAAIEAEELGIPLRMANPTLIDRIRPVPPSRSLLFLKWD
jgi:TRAP-type uncharacterized transport system fused permease subunit